MMQKRIGAASVALVLGLGGALAATAPALAGDHGPDADAHVEVTWLLPATFEGTPTGNVPAIWPQQYSADGSIPCDRWAQIDTYKQKHVDAMIADGWLHEGEDYHAVIDWRFEYGGDCATPEPEPDPVPPFTGVENHSPTYTVTCEAWTYVHPDYRLNAGGYIYTPSSFTIRLGDGAEFVPYTPGTVLAGEWGDPYVAHNMNVTLRAHFADGKPFASQQVGQQRLISQACDRPIPEQPADVVFTSAWVDTLDCDARTVTSTRYTETTPFVWDATAWEWAAGEPVTLDETVVRDATEAECPLPPVEEPEEPVTEEPVDDEEPTPVVEAPRGTSSTVTLPVTGSDSGPALIGAAIAAALGAALTIASVIVERRKRAALIAAARR